MNSTIEELGKLKYSLALEVSLDEIKPTYNAIYRELKKTKLNGFRPGKHPKGWLDKRFKAAMQQEAVDRVIPGYMDDALQEHSLRPATMPIIQKIDFDLKSPLSAIVHFEIVPELPKLNYEKIVLERKDIEAVSAKNISEELEGLIQREEVLVTKVGEDVKVEKDDWVLINYEGTIEDEKFADSTATEMQFKIGSSDLEEFHSGLMNMSSGDEKDVELALPERFGENAGKKAIFKIYLTEISAVKRPEIDEDFFKKFGVADEDELKEKVSENIKSRKTAELQSEYRIAVRAQLSDLYDDFNLPEELVKYGQEQVERELEQAFPQVRFEPDLIILLNSNVENGWKRVNLRKRNMELKDDTHKGHGLTFEFYELLHGYYDFFIEELVQRGWYDGPVLTLQEDEFEVSDVTNTKGQLYVIKSVKEALKALME